MSDALDQLLTILDLEQIEVNIFRGRSPEEKVQRVFGGQVAGQALVAAGRTVPADRHVHSLHAYFLRPGDPSGADRLRGGPHPRRAHVRDPAGRRDPARQGDLQPLRLLRAARGRASTTQIAMPPAPGPGDAADLRRAATRPTPTSWAPGTPGPARSTCATSATPPGPRRTRGAARARRAPRSGSGPTAQLGDDPLLHVCALTYASDMTLLDSVLLAHGRVLVERRRRAGPRWTTRCGSTGRSGPTSGCSTTRSRPRRPGPAGSPGATSSPRTDGSR